jgi:ribosomal-protein-alanine N-acetyltransferase
VSSWQLGTINRVDELDSILAIEKRSFQWPWGRLSFEGELTCKKACNCIARTSLNGADPQVIAYAFFRLAADELHLLKIAVTPAWRGRGVATRLLKRCFATSAKWGANSVHLEVRQYNTAAIELYQKLGFELSGKRHRYYEDTREDALLMVKKLKEEL